MSATATWFDSFDSSPLFGEERTGLDDFGIDLFESEAADSSGGKSKMAQIKELFADLLDMATSGGERGADVDGDDDDAGGNGNPQIASIKKMFEKLLDDSSQNKEGGGDDGGNDDIGDRVSELSNRFNDLLDAANAEGGEGGADGDGIDASLFGTPPDFDDLSGEAFGFGNNLLDVDDLLA